MPVGSDKTHSNVAADIFFKQNHLKNVYGLKAFLRLSTIKVFSVLLASLHLNMYLLLGRLTSRLWQHSQVRTPRCRQQAHPRYRIWLRCGCAPRRKTLMSLFLLKPWPIAGKRQDLHAWSSYNPYRQDIPEFRP